MQNTYREVYLEPIKDEVCSKEDTVLQQSIHTDMHVIG